MEGASRSLSAIVLTAGQGTRMRSERPKPLHLLCGRPMVLYVLDALATIGPDRAIIVVGHSADRVTKKLSEHDGTFPIEFVEQVSQLGTGDAVSVALTAFDEDRDDDDDVLVLPGDSPLLTAATVERLVTTHRESGAACTMLSAVIEDPTGYGRIVRGKGDRVVGIVEQADATPEQIALREVNTSMYCFRRGLLAPALRRVRPDNAQGELYLTDVIGVLHDAGYPVDALTVDDPLEAQGVNDRLQLAHAEAALRARTNDRWMRAGVTMVDPATTYLDATVRLAADVTLFPGTFLQGRTIVGEGAEIGPNTRIVDSVLGAGVTVSDATVTESEIGPGAQVGPYVVLGAGTSVAPGATVAPFTHLGNA
jgi:bifunctional UDP-N-acetylglucosamine pyrophosphorylase/glucosamine-1-phosphate N-acetyltransferase